MAETIEQIAYDAGRRALADQEALVAGIQQRTGTLLAAHALVASFLGATTIRAHGLTPPAWIALLALALGLSVAAAILSPWRLRFSLDAGELYDELQTLNAAGAHVMDPVATVGLFHQEVKNENASRVRRMSGLSGTLAALLVAQTLAWMAALVVS